ncbi:hypothetical protein EV426DRAFT_704323 [Tirmania nivea]|nr:hypothetical protein EV426DRAFT_704323 [Tirmania nivea]
MSHSESYALNKLAQYLPKVQKDSKATERLNLGQRVGVVLGKRYILLEAAWDAVGEDKADRERCILVAERGSVG